MARAAPLCHTAGEGEAHGRRARQSGVRHRRASGIGFGIVKALLEAGAKVTIADLRPTIWRERRVPSPPMTD
jgi:hypothetical protein